MAAAIDPNVAQLYRDCRDLATYIAKARREIAYMRPDEMKTERLPRAGKELEAIVQATEEATQTIMTAAENIIAADRGHPDAYRETIDGACMRIFEACSFQDITGQRITKVVHTLTYIEEKLNTLQAAWGPDLKDAIGIEDEVAPDDESRLLNGPALAGEGVSQADVDALMAADSQPAGGKAAPSPKPAAKPTQADIDALFD